MSYDIIKILFVIFVPRRISEIDTNLCINIQVADSLDVDGLL